MDLEDLKNTWSSLDRQAKDKNALSTEKIRKVLKSKYHSRLNRILFPELLITAGHFYFIVLIVFRFDTLETGRLEILGTLCLVLLILLPLIRWVQLLGFYRLSNPNQSPLQVMKRFAIQKIRFQRLQQINIGIGFFLMMSLIVLNTKIYGEYDITTSKYFWLISLILTMAFIGIFARWIGKYYNRSIQEAEILLKELE